MGASRYTTGTSGRLGGVDGLAVWAAGSMGDWNQVRDGTIGAHTDAGADRIEAGVDGDRPACILHMGTRSGGLKRAKSGTMTPT